MNIGISAKFYGQENYFTMTGNCHRNGDVDHLYISRKEGVRGIKNIEDSFNGRMIAITLPLLNNDQNNPFIEALVHHECEQLIRVGTELAEKSGISTHQTTPKTAAIKYKKVCITANIENYKHKITHGYVAKRVANDEKVDLSLSNLWLSDKFITSHFEGYANAIQQQEIVTKDLSYRRSQVISMDNKCRLCKTSC